ncbi:hypothetical protein Patl1_03708 [Pistacia atlantica]|uniref:Uncharacterized protein n=1 Tax=Pistacia atlantica TaxID=434234 RepID=A0ACC1BQF1_9ROSI|nr:hypothetical protein Patl1_03708 [Pistacia atlantica]
MVAQTVIAPINLTSIFSSLHLSLNATRSKGFSTGFYNTTVGQDPDKVYALFLCRGDITPITCQNCVNLSTSQILQSCPVEKEGIKWYNECIIRYSDKSIFSAVDGDPGIIISNPNNVTDKDRFDQLVRTTMKEAANEAAVSPKKFSTKKAIFTTSHTLYCLVQCAPDLSSFDCNSCLEQSFVRMPTTKEGGRVLVASCFNQFEFFPFYNENVTATPPPTPVLSSPPPVSPTPVSVTRPKGKSGISSSIIIAIIAPIVVAVVLFIAGYCFLIRRARKKNSPPAADNGKYIIFYFQSKQSFTSPFAWKHWRDGTPLQLLDSTLTDSCPRNEVIRCIHMGLLCVQEDPADRPTMAAIVIMLNSHSITLPVPEKPAFFVGSRMEASMATKEFDFDQSKSKLTPRLDGMRCIKQSFLSKEYQIVNLLYFMIFGFLSLLTFLLRFSSAADPTYVSHICSFSIKSTYQSNLNLLLSTLQRQLRQWILLEYSSELSVVRV